MTSAETAYLFRHALVRDAAYELQLPHARAALHALALDLLQAALPEGGPGEVALELARHAHAAREGVADMAEFARLGRLEVELLESAFEYAHRRFRHDDAIAVLRRLLAHDALGPGRKAHFHACLGEQLRNSGRNAEALVAGRRALAETQTAQGGRIYHIVAAAEEALGNYQASEQACMQGLALPDVPRGDARKLQATLCVAMALSGRSKQAVERARTLLNEAQDSDERAAALQILGPALNRMKLIPESREASREALELHRQSGNLIGQTVALINLGVAANADGDMVKARDLYQQALPLARATGNRRLEGLCLNNLGATSNDDPATSEHAYATYRQALAVTREVGDLRRVCFVLNGLSDTCTSLKRFDEARAAASESVEIANRIGAPDLALIARLMVGMACGREGRLEQAFPLLSAELPALRLEGHRNRMRVVLELLARCHDHRGEPEQAKAMRAELERWP